MSASVLTAPNVSAPNYVTLIKNANIGAAIVSPLEQADIISENTGRKVFLKLESSQPVFSFKLRGAYNKMAALNEGERLCGVVTASAGNHAQGVSLAAKTLEINATIVMPVTTPEVKVSAVRRLNHGVNVVLHGNAFPDALKHAQKLQTEQGMTFVHPYDDPLVIAGQGTIAREIFQQYSGEIEAIFVPVGGGGLISGIAAWTKHYHPNVKIIGVEPTDSNCMQQALADGSRVTLNRVGIFADGVAVAQVGKEPFRLAQKYVDEVICVNDDQICAAAVEIFNDKRVMPEPAGALALAGLKNYAETHIKNNGALIAIVSGANVDHERVRHMMERAAIAQKREMLLTVALPEKPGSLKKLCEHLGNRSITEFNYRHADDNNAHVLIGVRVQNFEQDSQNLLTHLRDEGYTTQDITNNELAREHVRHMVGGLPHRPFDEKLYSFEFSERPGALTEFLKEMPSNFDITLFHYRSHGAARGRVLMGFTAPTEQQNNLKLFAENSLYNGKNETHNPVYTAFLQHAKSANTLG